MVTVYLSLGSNQGDRALFLQRAIEALRAEEGIQVKQVAPFLETKPVGPVQEQPDFLNTVLQAETDLPPLGLLDRLLDVEQKLGRKRDVRWGPRTIDLDILYYGDEKVNNSRLQVPHPEIENRPFLKDLLNQLCAK